MGCGQTGWANRDFGAGWIIFAVILLAADSAVLRDDVDVELFVFFG